MEAASTLILDGHCKIDIFHNIMWSKYKGAVFSALQHIVDQSDDFHVRFFQIAETESNRVGLAGVDLSYHRYNYELLFSGPYDHVSKLKLVRRLFNLAWHSRSDVLVLPGYEKIEYWAMLLACILRRRTRAVFCDSTIYDQPQRLGRGIAKRIFFSFCHGYFAYGQRARAYLAHYGAADARIFERCQAAALPHGYSAESAQERRASNAPTSDTPRYLYVGRLSPEKSLRTLLQSFARVGQSLPKAELVLVGSGPQREELAQYCKQLGIENRVQFAGGKGPDDLAHEYSRATCLVLPSTSEPWGLVVNEALSYGCPVIVSHRCGCVPELVEGKHQTAMVFEAESVEKLTACMLEAPQRFEEVAAVASAALALMTRFTPEAAARAIVRGCAQLAAGKAAR